VSDKAQYVNQRDACKCMVNNELVNPQTIWQRNYRTFRPYMGNYRLVMGLWLAGLVLGGL
jgi:hypothetical protein